MIPFVTEELWQKLPWPEGNGSIGERPSGLIVAPWPTGDPERLDEEAEARMAGLQELITQARRLRKEYHVAEGKGVAVVLDGVSDTLRETVESQSAALLRLARVESVAVEGGGAGGVGAHAVLTDGTEMFIPLEGVIDLERERERLAMEIQRLEGQLAGVQLKLDNGQFVERAPEEVVEREREKARSFGEQLDKLREKLSELSEGA
jgi:valyl-tRNA synthetase